MLYPSGMLVARPALDAEGSITYTKHYFAGTQRVSSKIGTTTNLGKFLQEWQQQEQTGPSYPVMTTQEQMDNANEGAEKVYEAFEMPVPTFAGNTSLVAIPAFIHGTIEHDHYFFHPDHLGSSNYITNFVGEVSQHSEYFAFGETFIEEHLNSHNSPYKFNGKELDEESGLYYYGARYYDPRISIWASVDPLANFNPFMDDEHYIDGDHNGGVFNHFNHNSYGYCYQNPVRFIDPNGKQTDVVLFDTTNSTPEINEKEKRLTIASTKMKKVNNSFQVMMHGNNQYMRNVDEKGNKVKGDAGKINGPNTFDARFKNHKEWQAGKYTKGFNLILYSCNTGRGSKSVASLISKKYSKISVLAPTRQLWAGAGQGFAGVYGAHTDGTVNLKDPGYWIVYQKGVAVEAYDATWEPGTSTEGHKVELSSIPKDHYVGKVGTKDTSKDEDKKLK